MDVIHCSISPDFKNDEANLQLEYTLLHKIVFLDSSHIGVALISKDINKMSAFSFLCIAGRVVYQPPYISLPS